MKKCNKCGAPLEGFLYNTIGKLMGVKPSEENPEICNKCAEEKPAETAAEETSAPEAPAAPEVSAEPETVEAPAAPEVSAEPETAETPAEAEEEKQEPTV